MRPSAILIAAAALLAVPIGARAQGNPSSDQIINSLRPSGPLTGGTRGIRPVGPGTEPAAPAGGGAASEPSSSHASPAAHSSPVAHAAARAPAAAPATQDVAGQPPSVNLTVQFANGSSELTPAATHTLDELGHALSSSTLATYRFRIEGHTDTVGSATANKTLSEQRAEKVVDYLATKFNIDRSRLQAVGMGEDGLLVQTGPQTAEPRNRRVQVVNIGA
ncbi:MAG: OmpA family protein [Acidisphaera sp.]|nr:OmpA family protein [Acidisphaera sp.]